MVPLGRLFGLGLLLLGGGCSTRPEFTPGVVGLADSLPQSIYTVALPDANTLPKLAPERSESLYTIGPLDELIVTVWGRPDLGSQVPVAGDSRRNISIVQENGTIGLPFVGAVNVAGLTVAVAQSYIEELYAGIAEGAQIDITIATFRSKVVLLQGELQREGRLFLSDDIRTVGDAVNQAGGLTAGAETRFGVLVRRGITYRLDYRAAQEGRSDVNNVALENGDRIYFPLISERLAFVLGEVPFQGPIPIPPKGLSLVEALAFAGGPDVITANVKTLILVRNTPSGPSVHQFELTEALQSPDVQLVHGDRIYVQSTMLTEWDRFWRQLLPFFTVGATATNIPENLSTARRNILAD